MQNDKINFIYQEAKKNCSVDFELSYDCDNFEAFPKYLADVCIEKIKNKSAFFVIPKNNLKNYYFATRDFFKIAVAIRKACFLGEISIKWGGAWAVPDFSKSDVCIFDLYEKEEIFFNSIQKTINPVYSYFHLLN